MYLNESRREYKQFSLDDKSVKSNPFEQFKEWFEVAQKNALYEANAMTLCTVDENNQPSARIVLMKQFDERGFVFFTNYNSRKGNALLVNPQVSLSFYWPKLEQVIRIEGLASRITYEESNNYFQTRSRESQISAWASNQSSKVESRDQLNEQYSKFENKFKSHIPCPDFCGGYRVIPNYFEFFQGRINRFHDRICYERESSDTWNLQRISP